MSSVAHAWGGGGRRREKKKRCQHCCVKVCAALRESLEKLEGGKSCSPCLSSPAQEFILYNAYARFELLMRKMRSTR